VEHADGLYFFSALEGKDMRDQSRQESDTSSTLRRDNVILLVFAGTAPRKTLLITTYLLRARLLL
jgi:hypothetical protein